MLSMRQVKIGCHSKVASSFESQMQPAFTGNLPRPYGQLLLGPLEVHEEEYQGNCRHCYLHDKMATITGPQAVSRMFPRA